MMKLIRNFLNLVFLVLTFPVFSKDLSLLEIRTSLNGKQVVILGDSFDKYSPLSDSLVDWYSVSGDESTGFHRVSASSHAPTDLRGKRGIVVSVKEAESYLKPIRSGQLDAFNKPINDSQIINPYTEVIVKLNDDPPLFIGTTNYYHNMIGRTIQLASRSDAIREEIQGHLKSLNGKTLFKTGFTKLYDPSLNIDELVSINKQSLSNNDMPKNLTRLLVEDTKYFEAQNVVVIKVALPDKSSRLLLGDLDQYDSVVDFKQTILERIGISAVEKLPKKFTKKEIAAIRQGDIFLGMTEDAMYFSWGYPSKTNDWGRGGKQYIYPGNQYVYSKSKLISDWQTID